MFFTFTNHAIELKEYQSPIEMEQCLAKCDLGSIILGQEADMPDKFYGAIIHPQTSGLHSFGIGICSEGYGLQPHGLMLPKSNTILFGFNNQAVGININQREIAFRIELNSLFHYFLPIPEKNLILIIQELDIFAITENGEELWRYGGDVIIGITIFEKGIGVNFIDKKSQVFLDILRGVTQGFSATIMKLKSDV